MSVTAQLLRVFQVEKQIRSLQTRLKAAEGFLGQQQKELETIDGRRKGVDTTLKTKTTLVADQEGEIKRVEARMASLREKMENSQTNKEYQAILTELNTFKVEKDKLEATLLKAMEELELIIKQAGELGETRGERETVRTVAAKERDERHAEIQERLTELKSELAVFAVDVPKDTMAMFQRLLETRGEEAMGPLEIVDRKRHEYNCSVCMMAVPIESVNGLLSSGKLTRCSSCQCVLYLVREDEERIRGGGKKEKQSR